MTVSTYATLHRGNICAAFELGTDAWRVLHSCLAQAREWPLTMDVIHVSMQTAVYMCAVAGMQAPQWVEAMATLQRCGLATLDHRREEITIDVELLRQTVGAYQAVASVGGAA
jgi:hypothetical protein